MLSGLLLYPPEIIKELERMEGQDLKTGIKDKK